MAMRNAIATQIFEFRQGKYLKCETYCAFENIQVDHYEPRFVEMVNICLNKFDKNDISKEFDEDNGHTKIFKPCDFDFEYQWYDFHKSNANLRVLCKTCNTRRKRKDYAPKCCKFGSRFPKNPVN